VTSDGAVSKGRAASPQAPTGEGDNIQFEHQESFIARRLSSDGRTVGPEALFGRKNVSIMMTRSIGDKIGPRSCVAFPEISAVTVPAGRHARFILASDGFWDVVSIDTVRLVSLAKKYKACKTLANMLAHKAVRRRERAGLRQDDITVMVVDVNIGTCLVAASSTANSPFCSDARAHRPPSTPSLYPRHQKILFMSIPPLAQRLTGFVVTKTAPWTSCPKVCGSHAQSFD